MDKEILNYIPHRNTMALLDRIVCKEIEGFNVEVKITKDSALFSDDGVPSYCGVEYMAQSIAAYNTLFLEKINKLPRIGFMVSIRNFKTSVEKFKLGDCLNIMVDPVLIVATSGSFNCKILINNEEVSSSKITAYVPTDEELEVFKRETYE